VLLGLYKEDKAQGWIVDTLLISSQDFGFPLLTSLLASMAWPHCVQEVILNPKLLLLFDQGHGK
jgi:hypothetical protein